MRRRCSAAPSSRSRKRARRSSRSTSIVRMRRSSRRRSGNSRPSCRAPLRSGQLEVYFQPKVEIATRRVCGVEALVRWRTDSGNFVPASDFIPLAETQRRHRAADVARLRPHRRAARALGTRVPTPFSVAVNVSPQILTHAEFLTRVKALKDGARRAQVRVSRSSSPRTAWCKATRRRSRASSALRKLGVDLAIDDFGKGYSSLTYLKQIPAAEIKIDKRFIGTVAVDETDKQIVKTVIALAHALGMRVVAEGVDSAEGSRRSPSSAARWRRASSSAGRCAAISCRSGSTTTRRRRRCAKMPVVREWPEPSPSVVSIRRSRRDWSKLRRRRAGVPPRLLDAIAARLRLPPRVHRSVAVARVPSVRGGTARFRAALRRGARRAACRPASGCTARRPAKSRCCGRSSRLLERDHPGTPLVISAFTATGLAAARKLYRAAPRRAVAGRSVVRRRALPPPLQSAAARRRGVGVLAEPHRRRARPRRAGRARQRQDVGEVVPRARANAARPARAREVRRARRADRGARAAASQRSACAAAQLHVTGNMKYDLAPPSAGPEQGASCARRSATGRPTSSSSAAACTTRRTRRCSTPTSPRGRASPTRRSSSCRAIRPTPRSSSNARAARGFAVTRKTAVDAGAAAAPGSNGVLHRRHGRRARRACMRSRTSRSSAAACFSAARTRAATISWSPRSSACPCCSARTTSASRKPSTICSRPTRAGSCATRPSSRERVVELVARSRQRAARSGQRAQRVVEQGPRRDGAQLCAARGVVARAALSLATRRPWAQNAAVL